MLSRQNPTKRGMNIMTQGLFPFKYVETQKSKKFTGLSGLLLYLELFKLLNLGRIISNHLSIKRDGQGWSDEQIVLSLILLNLSGGACVDDIQKLEYDDGFCRILKHIELRGKSGRERKKLQKRWRRKRENTVPSQSSIFRYLSKFHNGEEEKQRRSGEAFIPKPNKHLSQFPNINSKIVDFYHHFNPKSTITLDIDATLIKTFKKNALYAYKDGKCYQPLNVWLAEYELILNTEFRDGNVPAGHEILRLLIDSLYLLPDGVEEVYLRSDTAAYQHDLLKYCAMGLNEKFGKINFAIGCDITPAFKAAIYSDKDIVWNKIYKDFGYIKLETGQEWAEVCFVPYKAGYSKKSPHYRYIAVREMITQKALPGMEEQLNLPFPTMEMNDNQFKLSGIVTNLDWNGEEIVHWYRKRCGKSEEVHGIMKEDFAGGKLPSSDFGENAAWWWMMILAINIQSIMKQMVLQKEWKKKRMKAIRYHIINIPALIRFRKGKFLIYLTKSHPSMEILVNGRKRIMELACLPAG